MTSTALTHHTPNNQDQLMTNAALANQDSANQDFTSTPAGYFASAKGNPAYEFGAPAHEGDPDVVSVPYAGQTRMQLTILSGMGEARLRVDPNATELLTIRGAEGLPTRVRVSPQELRVSWPKSFGWWLRAALNGIVSDIEIVLHPAVEWSLAVRGGVSRLDADLSAGKLARLDVSGGMSDARFDLPAPTAAVPVRVGGGVSELSLRRPATAGVSLSISGGVSALHLDDQHFGSIGGGSRLVSGAVSSDAPRYAVEISGGASEVCVTGH